MSTPLVVGFDLDLTLVDSRPGIAATYRALSALAGVYIDADAAVSRIGPPLTTELLHWFPAERLDWAGERFRDLYPEHAIEGSPLLPGAAEAVAGVRALGGSVVVITGKYEPNARRHLTHFGLVVDALVGWAWADGKVAAIGEHRVGVYVGDHPADMIAARTGGAVAVGVTTGSHDADELVGAGADVVLPDLTGFPVWLRARVDPDS